MWSPSFIPTTKCNCGSGKESWWEADAKGIPLARVCEDCREKVLSKYRPEILTGYSQADVDEPLEPEE
jgi:DNA-directed RNA polymerase subunit RPC12/RpoP